MSFTKPTALISSKSVSPNSAVVVSKKPQITVQRGMRGIGYFGFHSGLRFEAIKIKNQLMAWSRHRSFSTKHHHDRAMIAEPKVRIALVFIWVDAENAVVDFRNGCDLVWGHRVFVPHDEVDC